MMNPTHVPCFNAYEHGTPLKEIS